MRFHGLMLLRDEADIIAQTLNHLLSFIDGIFLLDMGSTDGTWDIVQDFARREARVVPYMSRPILFNDNLRSLLFDQFRSRFEPGDWVLRTDADEFYHVPPPQFVRERMRPGETAAYLQWYYFRLTRAEVEAYEIGVVNESEDRRRPIEARRRMYQAPVYSEPRMFRYRRGMQWHQDISFPHNAGFVARERLPIRHYPHRDVSQMLRRFELRSAMMKLNAHAGPHWKLADWRKDTVDATVTPAREEGVAVMTGLDSNVVHEWKLGTELPEVHRYDHLPPMTTRLVQRMIHPLLLPVLDRTRPAFDKTFRPTFLDPSRGAM